MFMRKAFVPLLASLLLCSAATGVLVATTARAQTEPSKPKMVEMVGPGTMLAQNLPNGPAARGMRAMPSAADIAQRRKDRCEDGYARQAGRVAYLETRLGLTSAQQPLFVAFKSVRLDIAKRHADECAVRAADQSSQDASPVDRMSRMEEMLKKRIADLDQERPVFTALYNALTPDQRKALAPYRHRLIRGSMGRRHRMERGMRRPSPTSGQTPPPQ